MKRLPPIPTRPVPETQKEWMRRWLGLWQIEQHIRSGPLTEHSASGKVMPPTRPVNIQPYHGKPLQLGEIRLLGPHLTTSAEEPVYVAAFSEWKPVGFLVAPFSRFPIPALTGEVYTGWKEPRLRVLNVWNSYSLAPDAINDSWLVDYLSPEECKVARAVFRHAIFGHELAAELQDRIGPPITHPEDPRLVYQTEELQRLADLTRIQRLAETDLSEIEIAALLAEADAIINAASLPEVLYAADSLVNRAVVLRKGDAPVTTRSIFDAEADGDFIIEPGQAIIPSTMWVLKDIAPDDAAKLAGSTVLFVDTRNKVVIAEGTLDESGTVISAHTIRQEVLNGRPFHAGDLQLLIMLE